MNTAPRKSIHPLMATAAIAVIVLSAVGVGAITGLIPLSKGTPEPVAPLTQSAAPEAVAPVPKSQTARVQAPAPVPAAPAPVRQAAPRPAEPVSQPAPVAAQAPRAPVQVAAAERNPAPSQPLVCLDCGTVESVREIKQAGDGSGLGAVAGGVAGAVLGNQVGGGSGRKIATVVGAVGGAVAGHQVEKHVKANVLYEISVRMDDGTMRTFSEANPPTWRSGDKVRVQGDRLTTQG